MKPISKQVLVGLLIVTGFVIAQEQESPQLEPPQLTVPDQTATPDQGGIPPVIVKEPGPEEVRLKKNEYKNNWKQAGQGDGRLGDRLRSHIVRLGDDDAVRGKLTVLNKPGGTPEAIQNVRIKFVRKGEVKAELSPDEDGSFVATDLEDGVYSMIVAGEDGFLAWSVNVKPKLPDIAKMPKHMRAKFLHPDVKDELDVHAVAVPPTNFTPLKQLLTQHLPLEDSTLYLDGEDFPEGMDNPPRDAAAATSLQHHQVRLTKDGRLLGRIRRLQPDSGRDLKIRQLKVYLLKDQEIVSQEDVAPNGTFAVEDLDSGVYSLVAAGRDGFLAFSIDILPARSVDTDMTRLHGLVPVAMRPQPADLQIDVALCSPLDFNQGNLADLTDGFVAPPEQLALGEAGPEAGSGGYPGGVPAGGPGAFGPTAGGGGGGGFGGGGLGGVLLGGAIGAGVGAIIADDDDGGRAQATPSSPTR
jgi:hypothetical protein